MNSFSIVIIGYNEEKNFEKVARDTDNVLKKISDDYEIILVNDGSTDGTKQLLERLGKEMSCVRLIHHERNQGIGASLRDGYLSGGKEIVTCLAADGQIDPVDIKRLYEAMNSETDFATSSYSTNRDSLLREILSAGYRIVLFVLFGRLPRLEGSYMFRRRVLEGMRFYTDTFVFNYELIIKAYKRKYSFAEISTTYIPRTEGKSKILGFRRILEVLFELLKLRWFLWTKGI